MSDELADLDRAHVKAKKERKHFREVVLPAHLYAIEADLTALIREIDPSLSIVWDSDPPAEVKG